MKKYLQFYINGVWVDPVDAKTLEVINPATEEAVAKIFLGGMADVDRAVAAANAAFPAFSQTSRENRIALMQKILKVYKTRYNDIAEAISTEMGAPITLSQKAQAATGVGHFMTAIKILKDYAFEEVRGTTLLRKEAVGVCGFITPWNWPINQIACKVAPALATGCTMILKPSEVTPVNAYIFAQVLDEAGVPAGVFNLVNGDGPTVGAAMSAHPDIDMMSFTGSTRTGIAVAKATTDTVNQVAQETGGKSANIILEDADFAKAVSKGVAGCMLNSGQSCNTPTRMLVPAARMEEATEGATPVTGGPGLPDGMNKGYFVRPTVFANVNNGMTIAREEVFGPVLTILGYENEDDAVAIANDTPYGLSGYVSSSNLVHAGRIAARLRTGNVHINNAPGDQGAPFGGYKQSGNGREWGSFGFEEFLEVKAVLGAVAAE